VELCSTKHPTAKAVGFQKKSKIKKSPKQEIIKKKKNQFTFFSLPSVFTPNVCNNTCVWPVFINYVTVFGPILRVPVSG